jgi:hypothetical protein
VGDASGAQLSTVRAAPAGGLQGFLPSLYKGYYGFESSVLIQNVDDGTARVELAYQGGPTRTLSISPGASVVVFQPNDPDLPAGWQGVATVRSTNGQRILAVANVRNDTTGELSAYNAVVDGSPELVVPALYDNYSALGWVSSLTIANADSTPATVEIAYGDGVVHRISSLSPGTSMLLYVPNEPSHKEGWVFGATVRALGGQRLVAVANAGARAPGASGDSLVSHPAVSR